MKRLLLLLAFMGIAAIGFSKDEVGKGNDNKIESTVTQNQRCCLYYTSRDGKIIERGGSSYFDATILSNTYKDGIGIIEFNAPITTIGDGAFLNCSSLTSVTIPDSVTRIGDFAFMNCSSLTSVTIPDSVTTVGVGAFASCSSLHDFNGKFASADGRCLIIDGVFGSFAPAGLTEYTIPDSVTTVGVGAFWNCSSLTSVTIPDSVTTVGDGAFLNCSSLTSVTIGDSITTIGDRAFMNCSSLTSVTIGDSVIRIGNSAFLNCSSLTSVTIPDSVTTIGNSAFEDCSSLHDFNGKFASADGRCLIIDGVLNSFAPAGLTEYTIPDSVTRIGYFAFLGCSRLTSVTIPDSVTWIEDFAFMNCSSLHDFNGKFASADGRCLIIGGVLGSFAPAGLTEYTIPDSVTWIGYSAFYGCRRLTSVTIPDSVTTIGSHAFRNCSSLTSVTIGDSVKTIGDWAFAYCSSLTSVTIVNSVKTIGDGAFEDCSSLISVYCKPTIPPTGYSSMFNSNAYGRKIYVPRESVASYMSASAWSSYANAIVGYNF